MNVNETRWNASDIARDRTDTPATITREDLRRLIALALCVTRDDDAFLAHIIDETGLGR